MFILTLFSFLTGLVTILSPCILPLLPIILATSLSDAKSHLRPYGIIIGFVGSFTFFTLFLSTLVQLLGVPADSLRTLSVIVIALFGLSLLIPRFQLLIETVFSRLASLSPNNANRTGLGGGIIVGLSLGLLWTPCVGPILASVISLAISGTVTLDAFILTLSYSLGTAIPMFLIIQGGNQALTRVPWLLRNTALIQRSFGIVMIATATLIYFGFDRTFQTYILTKFPSYGANLTRLEDNSLVQSELKGESKPQLDLAAKGSPAPELIPGGDWFNSDPLTLSELRGKVVLIDFWTYTCINCQRTLPYLVNWHDKYHDSGLVIIGVHAPEFEFEKNAHNVAQAISDFAIPYPVMQDNNFSTWRAYNNRYWPAKYLIDKDGQIRYTHFGEGKYDETETVIQKLLAETGKNLDVPINNQTTPSFGRTHETYLGSKRSNNESYLSYTGSWKTSPEYRSPSAGSTLTLQFNAQKVFLVMRNDGEPARLKVFLDGAFSKEVVVDADKLYTLVELDTPGSHTLRLEFLDDHAELFAFTFG